MFTLFSTASPFTTMADNNTAPTHHTCPSNANKHPADILKPAKKRRTKAEKAADDQLLKDARAA